MWVVRVLLTMMFLSDMSNCGPGWMGVGGEGGTGHDTPTTHVELWLWVDGRGRGGWYSP